MKWFRLYDELVDDPKVQLLPLEQFRALINLWCVASQNNGRFPSLEAMALKLRVKPLKMRQLFAALQAAGFIDDDGEGPTPHNWTGRQYLSDSSAERVKRMRAKRAEAGLIAQWTPPKALKAALYERDEYRCSYCGSEDDLSIDHKIPELRGGTHDIENLQILCRKCNAAKRDMTHEEYLARNGPVTLHSRFRNGPREQSQKTDPEVQSTQQSLNSELRASESKSLISPEAHTIAEQIGQAAGFSRENWPPGWCGAAYTVQKFLDDGCPGDLVRDTAIAILKRKRDGPPENFAYFDKPIAAAFAQTNRPLPTVIAPTRQTIEAPHVPRKRTVIDAGRDLIADIDARIAEAEARETGQRTGDAVARLLPPERRD